MIAMVANEHPALTTGWVLSAWLEFAEERRRGRRIDRAEDELFSVGEQKTITLG